MKEAGRAPAGRGSCGRNSASSGLEASPRSGLGGRVLPGCGEGERSQSVAFLFKPGLGLKQTCPASVKAALFWAGGRNQVLADVFSENVSRTVLRVLPYHLRMNS